MRTIHKVLVLFVILTTQHVFADDAMLNEVTSDKPCAAIAKACSAAGFVRERSKTKGIWRNCMEPTLLGKTVSGVKVDPAVVKSCRMQKIKKLQMQLEQFKQVK